MIPFFLLIYISYFTIYTNLLTMNLEILKTNAINAINALLEAQLIAISCNSGIDIDVLHNYVGIIPTPKKKRAPPKKKQPTIQPIEPTDATEATIVAQPVVEKKKRAPPKKKQPITTDVTTNAPLTTDALTTNAPLTTDAPVVEKKKRAPPKKKQPTTQATIVAEPIAEPIVTQPIVAQPKKRAPPKKKQPEKTKTINYCYLCQNTSDLRSTRNSNGFVCPTCILDPNTSNAFCSNCDRYEETDDLNLCGLCQTKPNNFGVDFGSHDSDSDSDSSSSSNSNSSDSDSDDDLPIID